MATLVDRGVGHIWRTWYYADGVQVNLAEYRGAFVFEEGSPNYQAIASAVATAAASRSPEYRLAKPCAASVRPLG